MSALPPPMPATRIHSVSGNPTDEEAVAIVAAIELAWPRQVLIEADSTRYVPRWRFSGRWWVRPVAARRERPF